MNASPSLTINQIDRRIDAIQTAMRRLEHPKPTPESWQAAWDRHPDLQAQQRELYRQRGVAQRERDDKAAAFFSRPPRYRAPKKCPTCGHRTLAA